MPEKSVSDKGREKNKESIFDIPGYGIGAVPPSFETFYRPDPLLGKAGVFWSKAELSGSVFKVKGVLTKGAPFGLRYDELSRQFRIVAPDRNKPKIGLKANEECAIAHPYDGEAYVLPWQLLNNEEDSCRRRALEVYRSCQEMVPFWQDFLRAINEPQIAESIRRMKSEGNEKREAEFNQGERRVVIVKKVKDHWYDIGPFERVWYDTLLDRRKDKKQAERFFPTWRRFEVDEQGEIAIRKVLLPGLPLLPIYFDEERNRFLEGQPSVNLKDFYIWEIRKSREEEQFEVKAEMLLRDYFLAQELSLQAKEYFRNLSSERPQSLEKETISQTLFGVKVKVRGEPEKILPPLYFGNDKSEGNFPDDRSVAEARKGTEIFLKTADLEKEGERISPEILIVSKKDFSVVLIKQIQLIVAVTDEGEGDLIVTWLPVTGLISKEEALLVAMAIEIVHRKEPSLASFQLPGERSCFGNMRLFDIKKAMELPGELPQDFLNPLKEVGIESWITKESAVKYVRARYNYKEGASLKLDHLRFSALLSGASLAEVARTEGWTTDNKDVLDVLNQLPNGSRISIIFDPERDPEMQSMRIDGRFERIGITKDKGDRYLAMMVDTQATFDSNPDCLRLATILDESKLPEALKGQAEELRKIDWLRSNTGKESALISFKDGDPCLFLKIDAYEEKKPEFETEKITILDIQPLELKDQVKAAYRIMAGWDASNYSVSKMQQRVEEIERLIFSSRPEQARFLMEKLLPDLFELKDWLLSKKK